jgi:membrane protein YdbS with pleckstrin-like domain
MKCQVCHAEAAPGALFCPHCGAKLAPSSAGGPSQSPPATAPPTDAAPPLAADSDPGAGPGYGVRRRAITDVPEETLWEGSYSPKAMLGSVVAAAIGSVVLVVAALLLPTGAWQVVPLGLIAVIWLGVSGRIATNRLGIHYKLTNQMFYHQHGVMTRVTNRVEAIDIDDVTYVQGMFDRLVDVGRIKITSSDRSDPELWVLGVDHVQDVAHLIDKVRRAERIRRGMSVEAV